MTRKEELLTQFKKELSLRNYSSNSIETYAGYLGMFLNASNIEMADLIITKAFANKEMKLEFSHA
jgi:hypothetical protein